MPSLGLLTVASTQPWRLGRAAASVAPDVCGTNVNGLVLAVDWMRRKSASSSCFEPVPATTIDLSCAALTKSGAVFHGLSSFTQRKNGSSARFAIGVKSVAL